MTDLKQHIQLSELNDQKKSVIENMFNDLTFCVVADITNHSYKEKTGYHYFDLAEKSENSNELLAKDCPKIGCFFLNLLMKFTRK